MVSPSESAQPGLTDGRAAPRTWSQCDTAAERLQALAGLVRAEVEGRVQSAETTLGHGTDFSRSVMRARFLFEALTREFSSVGILGVDRGGQFNQRQAEVMSAGTNPVKSLIGEAILNLEMGCRAGLVVASTIRTSATGREPKEQRRAELQALRHRRELEAFVDSEIGAFLETSDFARLAREHSSGRGGYDIIDKILTNRPSGPTLLGCLLDEAFLGAPAARAHQERIVDLREMLDLWFKRTPSDQPFTLVSVGCGPAKEIVTWIGSKAEAERLNLRPCEDTWSVPGAVDRLDIHLVDRDLGALALAQNRIGRALDARRSGPDSGASVDQRIIDVDAHVIKHYKEGGTRRGADSLPARGSILGTFRECAGLVDYLDDEATRLLLAANLYHAQPGALIVFTVVAPSDPFQAAREVLLKWPLIHRDRAALVQLGSKLKAWCEGLHESMKFMDKPVPHFAGTFRDDISEMQQLLAALRNDSFKPGSFCVVNGYKVAPGAEGVNQYLVVRANA
ncbi:MAG: hypothetical protein K1X79_01935 [Oligoflexia bacterium]|nr:hypothetical protein [Oligoflexia bacterium]